MLFRGVTLDYTLDIGINSSTNTENTLTGDSFRSATSL
jgi:hypothetical protein